MIYDPAGNRTHTRFPNGVTQRVDYDPARRVTLVQATDAAGQVLTRFAYGYARQGADSALRQTVTDRLGRATSYAYDRSNRLTAATTAPVAGAPPAPAFAYRYDARSNRTAKVVDGAETRYGYNAADQLTTADGPDGPVAFSYDANGNLTGSSQGLALAYSGLDHTTAARYYARHRCGTKTCDADRLPATNSKTRC